ncbi:hypothetical protein BU23DRAFT_597708 [Bimuria novae-zelandiae CBS 107.79]|uniref:Myb/SANT-like domain-containing protein n=1 Tax=Bimuria novae-zelandiae CBS 107.79 TaxID=1447943 RepID=A0A6A5VFQ0_9PLEO|nr:hypothetical protein BU23DRAFT_597708 [Bimuria novae-zelandiae CBS 107.79]
MPPSTPRNKHLERVAQAVISESPSPSQGSLPQPSPQPSSSPSPSPRHRSSTPSGRSRMTWSDKQLETLLEALCFTAREGNRADGKFKPQGWAYAQKEVQKVSGNRPVTIEQCKGKVDTCKKEW